MFDHNSPESVGVRDGIISIGGGGVLTFIIVYLVEKAPCAMNHDRSIIYNKQGGMIKPHPAEAVVIRGMTIRYNCFLNETSTIEDENMKGVGNWPPFSETALA